MTRAARAGFVVLVAATFAAFFVVQRLKRAPPVVRGLHESVAFSPNGDGHRDRGFVSFFLERSDDVTLSVLDDQGDEVRRLADGQRVPALRRVTFRWDGRAQTGGVAPQAGYRVQVALARQGRSLTLPGVIALDTRPPRPAITALRPRPARGPAVLPLPKREPVTVRFRGTLGHAATLLVYRTDRGRPRVAARVPIPALRRSAAWNGRIGGRPAPAGAYLLGLRVGDLAGNVGYWPGRAALASGRAPGHAGVTVRYLAVTTPPEPVPAHAPFTASVDARGRPYSWALRRVGSARVRARGGARRGIILRLPLRAPRGSAGLYTLTVRAGAHRALAPVLVTRPPARRRRPRVLVVLPTLSWAGRNPIDLDGNGLPDTLANGGVALLGRPFAPPGLPVGFERDEAPLLAFLDRARLRYDLATDALLASGGGGALRRFRGVVLAGRPEWVPAALGDDLRRYVRGGGRVLTLGTGALRRTVRVAGDRLVAPSPLAATDVLGARIGPVAPLAGALSVQRPGASALFGPAAAVLPVFTVAEPTLGLAPPARVLASAGPARGRAVLVAYRLGRGLVVRTGLPGFSAALDREPGAGSLLRRIWTALGR